jgi:acetolactate synthase-1/2/3 large subunit
MAIDPNEWLGEFSKTLTPDDTVVCDAGGSYFMTHQRIKLPEGARLITDLAQAAMGFAIPAAIGAALAKDKGMVYAITGDGSYEFMSHNVQTMASEDIRNVDIIVFDNHGYKTIRTSQDTWCKGRHIGLQDWDGDHPMWDRVHTFECGPYEMRRPVPCR